ncbi:MAG TPA: saccharopine dehydrogenase NADP-binding domain-containing protein [Flexivirga sp.]|uniref:saccharopine dehydrogenase family protein n=1 Tax=Flexivirga sp. TaxID=1962927 RepID=UPI002C750690|nr:saccharopine dehydrogenase NADP-binding domain-containing protein [Flexivirga sp.]HWC21125.1 saccharopine dehydrogenase NADP-binding domain-containing protein [Flexivirga sp.]
MGNREHDIVLFGATGFVGTLTAEYLARHTPDGVRVALAGRTRAKLEAVRDALPGRAADWPVLVADSSDTASLQTLAESARVVISTVGPYAKYGLPLVEACATAGTDYVDLTGEVLFVRESIDRFQELANGTGARIVHSCGFDSVPSDLGAFVLSEKVHADGAGDLGDTTLYMAMKGGVSGGTVASAMIQLDEVRADKDKRKVALDKFALSPDRAAEPSGEWRDSASVRYAEEIDAWTGPFVMATFNTRIVRRSNALQGHGYGRSFRYREVQRTGRGIRGRLMAYAMAGGLGLGFGAMSVPLLRPVVDRVLPSPGDGPDEKSRDAGYFKATLRTTTTTGASYTSVVAAQGDPGYKATAVMLGESALCLAVSRDECPLPEGLNGGVLTPATALGTVLVERLRAQDFTISAEAVQ